MVERQKELRDVVSGVRGAGVVFSAAFRAARALYGDTYNGTSTDRLSFPHLVVTGDYPGASPDEAFLEALLDALRSDGWKGVKSLAASMGADPAKPLPEAARMATEMTRVEQSAGEAARVLAAAQGARLALEVCREAATRR